MSIEVDGVVIWSDSESDFYTREMIEKIVDDYLNGRGFFAKVKEYLPTPSNWAIVSGNPDDLYPA